MKIKQTTYVATNSKTGKKKEIIKFLVIESLEKHFESIAPKIKRTPEALAHFLKTKRYDNVNAGTITHIETEEEIIERFRNAKVA